MPFNTATRFAVGVATALSTTEAAIKCTKLTATDAKSEFFPAWGEVRKVRFKVTSIASSATQITFYLAADSAGDVPLSAEVTATIRVGKTTATSGGVVVDVDSPEVLHGDFDATNNAIYVVARTNTGTCTVVPYVYFQR